MLQHTLDKRNTTANIVLVVHERLPHTFTHSLESCKVDHALERSVSRKYVIKSWLVTDVHLLKDDHIVALARDLLNALKAHLTAVVEVVDDHDLREATEAVSLDDLNHSRLSVNIAQENSATK